MTIERCVLGVAALPLQLTTQADPAAQTGAALAMAATISVFNDRHDLIPRRSRTRLLLAVLRQAPRRVGVAAVSWLGLAAELGWALFGSLALGLGARPPVTDRATALAWLAGAALLAAVTGLAAWLAAPRRSKVEPRAGNRCARSAASPRGPWPRHEPQQAMRPAGESVMLLP